MKRSRSSSFYSLESFVASTSISEWRSSAEREKERNGRRGKLPSFDKKHNEQWSSHQQKKNPSRERERERIMFWNTTTHYYCFLLSRYPFFWKPWMPCSALAKTWFSGRDSRRRRKKTYWSRQLPSPNYNTYSKCAYSKKAHTHTHQGTWREVGDICLFRKTLHAPGPIFTSQFPPLSTSPTWSLSFSLQNRSQVFPHKWSLFQWLSITQHALTIIQGPVISHTLLQ